MVVGIALFGMLMASLAAYFVGENTTTSPAEDQAQRLTRAKAMLDQGLISKAEHQDVKARLLASIWVSTVQHLSSPPGAYGGIGLGPFS